MHQQFLFHISLIAYLYCSHFLSFLAFLPIWQNRTCPSTTVKMISSIAYPFTCLICLSSPSFPLFAQMQKAANCLPRLSLSLPQALRLPDSASLVVLPMSGTLWAQDLCTSHSLFPQTSCGSSAGILFMWLMPKCPISITCKPSFSCLLFLSLLFSLNFL